MKAVILNSGTFGSTGNIAKSLGRYLQSDGHKVLYCYARGDKPEGIKLSYRFEYFPEVALHGSLTRITGWQGTFSVCATARLLRRLEQFQAQVYFLENLHGYYLNERMLFDYLGKTKAKVIYLMLDEYAFLGRCDYSFECVGFQHGCGRCKRMHEYPKTWFFDRSAEIYRQKKENYDKVRDLWFVGINWTVNRARTSPMMENRKFFIADEAIDLRQVYFPRRSGRIREYLKIPVGKKIALCVAPMSDPRKGCRYFLEAARLLSGDPSVVFVHVGVDVPITDVPENYIQIGFIQDQRVLCKFFSVADVLVCPSLAETVPAVCLEALACGTPIIAFAVSGLPECAKKPFGTFVNPKDSGALAAAIAAAHLKTKDSLKACRKYAKSRYDDCCFNRKMEELALRG